MPEIVTIEGSIKPCAELPRGQRRKVAMTDRVQRLIKRGYVVVVERHGPSEEPAPAALDEQASWDTDITPVENEESVADASDSGDVSGDADRSAESGGASEPDHQVDAPQTAAADSGAGEAPSTSRRNR